MNNFYKGKVAWITGSKRIGQEIAVALAKRGMNLVITYRSSQEEALLIVEKVKPYGVETLVLQADVSDRHSVEGAVSKIKEKFGELDLLILLASVFKPIQLSDINEKSWEENFSVHVKGSFWPIQFSAPIMPSGSHIITISDRTAIGRIYPGYLPYVVTKSAVAALTQALAVELGSKGIFINAIAPGPVLRPDDISEHEWQAIRDQSIIAHPLSDEEAVQEFVDTVLRLSTVRSSGSIYPLDFGHM